MQVYLPIAEISVNIFYIMLIGLFAGMIGSLFSVGGSFLGVPLLISYGIDSPIVISSYTHQMITIAFLAVINDVKEKRINFKLVFLTFIGGSIGSIIGIVLFKYLTRSGQIDLLISFIYIFILGGISFFMLMESSASIFRKYFPNNQLPKILERFGDSKEDSLMSRINSKLPKKVFISGEKEISIYLIIFFGLVAGLLVSLAGISSGFIMIPIMIYIYKLNIRTAISTANMHGGLLVTLSSTLQTVNAHTTDLVLSLILTCGTVIGVLIARKFANKIPPEELRVSMGIIMLILIIKMILNVVMEPSNIFSVSMIH